MSDEYRTRLYRTKKGEVPVAEFMTELNRTGRAKGASKIIHYSRLLREQGLALGFPYVSHVRGDLWELRATQARSRVSDLVLRRRRAHVRFPARAG